MATRIGEMACLNPQCKCTDMTVEVTPAGTWQAKCHKCGLPTFAKAGTKWRRTMESLTTLDDGTPSPQPVHQDEPVKPEPPPIKRDEPKKPSSAFSLGDLS